MRKFVRSGGTYSPSDALGTSAQDYYNKFFSMITVDLNDHKGAGLRGGMARQLNNTD